MNDSSQRAKKQLFMYLLISSPHLFKINIKNLFAQNTCIHHSISHQSTFRCLFKLLTCRFVFVLQLANKVIHCKHESCPFCYFLDLSHLIFTVFRVDLTGIVKLACVILHRMYQLVFPTHNNIHKYIYIYIYIHTHTHTHIYIHIVDRVFANGPGDWGSIPGRVIAKTKKMILDTALLNT